MLETSKRLFDGLACLGQSCEPISDLSERSLGVPGSGLEARRQRLEASEPDDQLPNLVRESRSN